MPRANNAVVDAEPEKSEGAARKVEALLCVVGSNRREDADDEEGRMGFCGTGEAEPRVSAGMTASRES